MRVLGRVIPLMQLVLSPLLWGDDTHESHLIFENEPSTILHGVLNLQSGAIVIAEQDLSSAHPDGLTMEHFYTSFPQRDNGYGRGVYLGYATQINDVHYCKTDKQFEASVHLKGGSSLAFGGHGGDGNHRLKLAPKLAKALSNTGRGVGAATDLRNKVVELTEGTSRPNNRIYTSDLSGLEQWFHPRERDEDNYLLDHETLPTGNARYYSYNEDGRLQRVELRNRDKQLIGWLDIEEGDGVRTVCASNGEQVRYRLDQRGKKPHLRAIESSQKPTVLYNYTPADDEKRVHMLEAIDYPDNRTIYFGYPELKRRVTAIKIPEGRSSDVKRLYKIKYHACGVTDVHGLNGHKRSYIFGSYNRLSRVEEKGHHDRLYRERELFWGEDADETRLIAQTVRDEQRQIRSAMQLEYDWIGNPIRTHIYGNLTGGASDTLGSLKESAPSRWEERFTTTRSYTSGKQSLLQTEQEEGGALTVYNYGIPGTNLMTCKVVQYGGKIQQREFYEYDESGFVISHSSDDGSGKTEQDLSDVTVRRITRFVRQNDPTQPGFGLPLQTTQSCVDPVRGEQQLSRTVCSYTKGDKVATQTVYDADDQLAYTLYFTYNEKGWLTSQTDAFGRETRYAYDDNGNCIREERLGSGYVTETLYDRNNRPDCVIERHSNGDTFVRSQAYDLLGQVVASTDEYGRTTEYTYDALGRQTHVVLPELMTASGDTVRYVEEREFDYQDKETCVRSPEGHETRTEYNVRGQPIWRSHADGTEERWIYWKNGTLRQHIHKNGTSTYYRYDEAKHLLEESCTDWSGAVVATKQYVYKGDLLVSSKDEIGAWTHYTYDGAGRKILEWTENGTTLAKKSFHYDSLGRLSEERTYTSDTDYLSTHTRYDLLDRPIETWEETEERRVLNRQVLIYDSNDQVTETLRFDDDGSAQSTHVIYDTRRRPILEIDALGNETYHEYEMSDVLVHREIDALGRITETESNALGQLAYVRHRDPMGKLLSEQAWFYDGEGNTVEERTTRFYQDEAEDTVRTEWEYGPCQQLLRLVESGTRVTHYSYNSAGQREAVVKPDRTVIYSTYDWGGRLQRIWSSDQSVDYSYSYFPNGWLRRVWDAVHETETVKGYDGVGRPIIEQLGNGLEVQRDFDTAGRCTQLMLPDGSSIQYTYEGLRRKTVHRNGQTHSYAYNDRGLLVQSADLTMHHDAMGRIVAMEHPEWREELSYDDVGRIVSRNEEIYSYDELDHLTAEEGHQYRYDSLHNRREKDGDHFTVDNLNQLEGFDYDPNGNLQQLGDKRLYYDALDRLIRVETPDETWQYHYDACHRRLDKSNGTVSEAYLYDGENEIGCVRNGALQELRVLGEGLGAEIGGAVFVELHGKTYRPVHNHHGDLVRLLDSNGAVAAAWDYTAFGEIKKHSGIDCAWGYSSKRVDPEAKLSFFGRRYYSADLGRWITTDPKGYSEGPNLYAYVGNNPLGCIDLYGLSALSTLSGWCSSLADKIGWGVNYAVTGQCPEPFPMEMINRNDLRVSIHDDGHFIVGHGEVSDRDRLVFTPGIQTTEDKMLSNALLISEAHGGCNVHVINDVSDGILPDFGEIFKGDTCIDYPAVELGCSVLGHLFREMDAPMHETNITVWTYSKGAGTLYRMLMRSPKEQRKQINQLALAPYMMMPNYLLKSALAYANSADRVPLLDRWRAWLFPGYYGKLHFIGDSFTHAGCHSFECPNHVKVIREKGKKWVNTYGRVEK